ncbi:MAG: helix-turn-helix domain-containing protein [Patescibacteria group bacterium]|nr:helix-turn-helix domain-containing protein [Patescibacteria group bacterium]
MKKHKKLQSWERDKIAIMRAKKKSIRQIARRLKRSPSTISDEVDRGKDKTEEEYVAIHAQYLSEQRMIADQIRRVHLRQPQVWQVLLQLLLCLLSSKVKLSTY